MAGLGKADGRAVLVTQRDDADDAVASFYRGAESPSFFDQITVPTGWPDPARNRRLHDDQKRAGCQGQYATPTTPCSPSKRTPSLGVRKSLQQASRFKVRMHAALSQHIVFLIFTINQDTAARRDCQQMVDADQGSSGKNR